MRGELVPLLEDTASIPAGIEGGERCAEIVLADEELSTRSRRKGIAATIAQQNAIIIAEAFSSEAQ